MKTGIELIAEERERQIKIEGWTEEHDKQWNKGELARAAACYIAEDIPNAEVIIHFSNEYYENAFPWDPEYWKPTSNPVRNLQKAGALIAAEIDRLQALAKE